MPKHIKVTLDFISVEDELPDDGAFYAILEYGEWPRDMWAKFCWENDEWRDSYGSIVDVTHWTNPFEHPLTNAEE